MDYFFVSPTESLLIGFCVGDYLEHREHDKGVFFLNALDKWVGPFVPCLTGSRRVQIPEDDIPGDAELAECQDGTKTGLSPSHPNVFYGIDDEGAFCTIIDTSRKSLLVLLSLYLGDRVARSAVDEVSYPRTEPWDLARVLTDLLSGPGRYPDESLYARSGNEDPAEVERALIGLMKYNECEESFAVGKLFGASVSICENYEKNLWEQENPPEEVFCDRFPTTLEALLATDLVGANHHAERMLRRCVENPPLWPEHLDDFNYALSATLSRLNQTRGAIWLAFGEVLGSLREIDQIVKADEWSSVTPRTFRDLFDATGDKVRRALRDAEAKLSVAAVDADLPMQVVRSLGAAIEATVRRVFELPSTRRPQQGMVSLLDQKLKFGNACEQRFAATAIYLYKNYRNPAEHGLEKFTCTFEEARLFVAGIRSLLKLAEAIQGKPG